MDDRSDYNSFGRRYPLSRGYRILVNGHSPLRSLNLPPLLAVERIEILNNGTATFHDGVAVPGAINIVLRRDHEGFEVVALDGGFLRLEAGRPARLASSRVALWEANIWWWVWTAFTGLKSPLQTGTTAAPNGPKAASPMATSPGQGRDALTSRDSRARVFLPTLMSRWGIPHLLIWKDD